MLRKESGVKGCYCAILQGFGQDSSAMDLRVGHRWQFCGLLVSLCSLFPSLLDLKWPKWEIREVLLMRGWPKGETWQERINYKILTEK